MTEQHILDSLNENSKAIKSLSDSVTDLKILAAAQTETIKTLDQRLSENDEVVKSVYRLATSVEVYATKVESLTDKMETRMCSIESIQTRHTGKIDILEKRPGNLSSKVIWIISTAILTGIGGYILSLFLNN